MGRPTAIVGQDAEERVFQYLLARKLSPIARNFRCRGGELDLIMLHNEYLVFVEVRYRGLRSFTRAAHTVDQRKQKKLVRAAAMFTARNREHANRVMRFDVVGVDGSRECDIEWIQDAFRPSASAC